MSEIISLFVSALVLGLAAGFSPGPILTLVISETLKHNRWAGIKIAMSPLITDGPILLISLFLLTKLSSLDILLGLISLFGAGFLVYVGYESLTTKEVKANFSQSSEQSLKKGIIANALSPHPYVFYLSIGGPLMVKALGISIFALVLFLTTFLSMLVVSKIGIALLVERSRSFLNSKAYFFTLKGLGIALLFFAALFVRDALVFFKII